MRMYNSMIALRFASLPKVGRLCEAKKCLCPGKEVSSHSSQYAFGASKQVISAVCLTHAQSCVCLLRQNGLKSFVWCCLANGSCFGMGMQ